MSSVNVQILGQAQLAAKLRRMGGKAVRQFARKVTAKAMAPILSAAKADAPVGPTGRLRASLGRLQTTSRKGDAFSSRVGTRRDFTYRTTTGERRVSGRGKVRDRAMAKGFTADRKTAQQYARVIEFGRDSKGRIRRQAGPAMFLVGAIRRNTSVVIGSVESDFRQFLASST